MKRKSKAEHILVDGYNTIFAWDELRELADHSLADARDKLLDTLADYQGATGHDVTVVFDAHKVKDGSGAFSALAGVSVVYTKEGETADNLIESLAAALSREAVVRVVTSDYVEQIVSFGRGAFRMSTQEFAREVAATKQSLRQNYIGLQAVKRNLLIDNLDEATARMLENMRYSNPSGSRDDSTNSTDSGRGGSSR
ncbi:MAG: NYN domain-containing protein [Defluviitaleaceae bacterium]|nr:NYN domain-containing protein [Defluviitaleaceae bacterium]